MARDVLFINSALKGWREFRKLTKTLLAQKCNVQVGYISRLEAGKIGVPTITNLKKIAIGLGVPESVLYLGLVPNDLITPDLPNAATLADTDGGIEVLLAIYFLKIARTKDAKFWLYKETK